MGGLFGIAAKKSCSKDVFYGTDYHSHLAANWAGIAITTPEEGIFRKSSQIKNVQFKVEFADTRNLVGNYGIGVLANERQPICGKSKLGDLACATDSTIFNLEDIVKDLFDKGVALSEASFKNTNHTEVISKLICQKNDIESGIKHAFQQINGFCSLLLLTENGIYAARDKYGLNSLVLGKRDDAFAIASESSAFPNLGLKIEKFLAPGEIIRFDETGYETKKQIPNCKLKHCIFNWIYFSDPCATHEGVTVEQVRNNCGAELAAKDLEAGLKADVVCGVPDSGMGHGIGYSNKSGIPYGRVLGKYNAGWSRSYMPPTQETRDEIAWFKQIPNSAMIKDKEIVIVDDSIRRGTQLKKLVREKLLPYTPKGIHIRVASPPQLYPCIRDKSDAVRLATRRAIDAIEGMDIDDFSEYKDITTEKYAKMVDYIRNEISATTLAFISLDSMAKATGLPKENLCLYCWTGEFSGLAPKKVNLTQYV